MIAASPHTVAHSVVEQFLGRTVDPSKITPMTGGRVNHVFDYDDELVIRICHGPDALATFQKERWSINTAAALGVRTPEVLNVGSSNHYATMLQVKVRGTIGARYQGQLAGIWRELGRFAKLINSVPVQGTGNFFLLNDGTSNWRAWVEKQRAYLFENMNAWQDCLTINELVRIESRFERLAELQFTPVLAHANINLYNVVVDEYGKVFLLDWGNAGGYAWYWDLAELITWHDPDLDCIKQFCEGYEISCQDINAIENNLELIKTWRWVSNICCGRTYGENWQQLDIVRLSLERLRSSIANNPY